MNEHAKRSEQFQRLRAEAEKLVRPHADKVGEHPDDVLALIQELDIYQAELQIQNEELKQAQHALIELKSEFEDLYEFAPCAYLTLNPRGVVARINLVGVRLLGLERQRLGVSTLSRFVAPGSRDAYFEALKKAGESGEKQSLEIMLSKQDRRNLWTRMEIQAQRTPADVVEQWRLTFSDITEAVQVREALQRSEENYRLLFRRMVGGAMIVEPLMAEKSGIVTDGRIVQANPAFEQLTGIPVAKAVGRLLSEVWPHAKDEWSDRISDVMRSKTPLQTEFCAEASGKQFLLSLFGTTVDHVAITFIDISAHKQMESAFVDERDLLESKVSQHTAALEASNIKLVDEIKAREQAQNRLQQKMAELEERSEALMEANVAFKVLLGQRDSDRRQLEERVMSNLNELVRPALARLATMNRSEKEQRWFDILERNIDEIIAPMSHRLIIQARRLTPVETQVADLIRQGKSTKEISGLLGVAASTIDFHRLNIRRKLKLTNKPINLRTYLNSLS